MKSDWTKNLKTKEEKERFASGVQGSKIVFKRMAELLDEYDREQLLVSNDYDNLNWAYRQADVNGYRRCIRKIQDLINLDQGKQ